MAKLNPVSVMEMRSKYAAGGHTIEQLAREYHVSWNAARAAIKGTSYQDVDMVAEVKPSEEAASEARLASLLGIAPIAAPAEDPLDAILRRRSAGLVLPTQENDDEQAEQTDGGSSSDATQGGGVRAPDGG